MNITIFGDSFGDDQIDGLIKTETSWMDVLREQGHSVTNHCRGGSSLYYSYKRYLEFLNSAAYSNCDLIIFLITGPGREEVVLDGETFYMTSISQIEVRRDYYAKSEQQRKIFDAMILYWAFCKDHKKEEIIHDLMIKEIKKCEKTLVIETYIPDDPNCMVMLSRKELSLIVPEIKNNLLDENEFMKLHIDCRKCHFTSVNNRMIGNKILQAINADQKTVEFDVNDIVKPEFDYAYYFKKHV
jgi:hypothetical protein